LGLEAEAAALEVEEGGTTLLLAPPLRGRRLCWGRGRGRGRGRGLPGLRHRRPVGPQRRRRQRRRRRGEARAEGGRWWWCDGLGTNGSGCVWLCVRLVFFSWGLSGLRRAARLLRGPPRGPVRGPTCKRDGVKVSVLLGSDRPAAGAFGGGVVGPGACVSWADPIGGCPPGGVGGCFPVGTGGRVTHLPVTSGVSPSVVFPAILTSKSLYRTLEFFHPFFGTSNIFTCSMDKLSTCEERVGYNLQVLHVKHNE
jgi:hypothetical protein